MTELKALRILRIAIAVGLLCSVTLLFGSPIVNHDSVYYWVHAFFGSDKMMLIRPIIYSHLIGLYKGYFFAPMIQSFWLVVLLQFCLDRLFIGRKYFFPFIFLAITITPLLIFSNTISPDIFSVIQLLSLFLIWDSVGMKSFTPKYLFFVMSLVVATSMHFSHLITGVVFAILISVVVRSVKTTLAAFSMVFLSFVILLAGNFFGGGKFIFSEMENMFLLSRIMAQGNAGKFIGQECKKEISLELCALESRRFDIWNWSRGGVISEIGGVVSTEKEAKQLTRHYLSDRDNLFQFAKFGLSNSIKQFFLISDEVTVKGSPLIERAFADLFPGQFENYKTQKIFLNDHKFELNIWKKIHGILFWFSILLAIYMIFWGDLTATQRKILGVIFVYWVINSIVCGALTEPSPRYNARFLWLVSPLVIIFFLVQLSEKIRTRTLT